MAEWETRGQAGDRENPKYEAFSGKRELNPFPNKSLFLRVCSRSLYEQFLLFPHCVF